MLSGPLSNVSIPAGGALVTEQTAESLQHLGIAILKDLRNLILKDAFKKMELVFYRQLCHLGPEIQVTSKGEKANYGPNLGIGRLFRITRRHVEELPKQTYIHTPFPGTSNLELHLTWQ